MGETVTGARRARLVALLALMDERDWQEARRIIREAEARAERDLDASVQPPDAEAVIVAAFAAGVGSEPRVSRPTLPTP